MRYLIILFLLIMLSAQASAQNIGSIAYESEKSGPGTAEYTIGIFNMGNSTYEVEMSSPDFEGDIEYSENPFVLEPSEISSDPSGEGWYSISANKYVKPREQKITVRSDKSQNFTVEAVFTEAGQESQTGAEVVQILSNRLSFRKTEGVPGFSGYTGEDEEKEQELELKKSEEREENEENASRSLSERTVDRILGSNETSSGGSEESSGKTSNEGFDPLTGVLALGAAGSVLYLWSVL